MQVLTHICVGIIFAVHSPHDLVSAEGFAVNDQMARFDLAEINASVIRKADLHLKTCYLAILYDISKSCGLNNLFFHDLPSYQYPRMFFIIICCLRSV